MRVIAVKYLIWDFMIQCDKEIEANRPDAIAVSLQKKRFHLSILPFQVMSEHAKKT